MEIKGGNERYCRLSHPPPLAGGGKNSRQRIFGGWRNAAHHSHLATPRDRFALAPPPQAAEGKNSFLSKKEFPFPRKRESPYPLIVKNDAVRALLAPANREIPAFAGMEGEGGNGRGGREWKGRAGMEEGGGNEKRSGNGRGEWESS